MRSNKIALPCLAIVLFLTVTVGMSFAGQMNYTPPADSTEIAITHYSFGIMDVNGTMYEERDLLILPDGRIAPWHVEVTHNIQIVDVKDYINNKTKVVIIGTGDAAVAEVAKETQDYIKSKGIELHVLDTANAAKLFNKFPKEGLVGLFHLNC